MKVTTNSEKIKYLSAAFGDPVVSSSGENASFSCPECTRNPKVKKGKKKLSVSLETGMYHCWVCEAKGRNIAYFARKNNASNESIIGIEGCFGKIKGVEEKKEEVLILPDDFSLLGASNSLPAKIAKNYLYSRGLNDDDIFTLKAGISSGNSFINKIIFPSFDSNLNLNFYVSRTYDENQKIKYVNCSANKKDVIFDEYNVDFSKELILVEGVFDYIRLKNKNACCILGSWIDENYLIFKKIVENRTPVILALDADALDKSHKIAKKLSNFCINVKIIDDIKSDIGDMSLLEIEDSLIRAKHYDNTDRLRYLINGIKSGSIF
tara:strand:+ start:88 stop:1053 length:966 start_codon:yes stop_codon:yes gene_type:complete